MRRPFQVLAGLHKPHRNADVLLLLNAQWTLCGLKVKNLGVMVPD